MSEVLQLEFLLTLSDGDEYVAQVHEAFCRRKDGGGFVLLTGARRGGGRSVYGEEWGRGSAQMN